MKVMIVRGKTLFTCGVFLAVISLIVCLFGVLPESIAASASTQYRLIRKIDTLDHVIAVTADGRENDWYAEEFLAYLKRYGAKATFFVTGSYAREYAKTLDEIHAGGHSLQSLGCKGADLSKMSLQQLTEDLRQASALFRKYTWGEPTLVRCTTGEVDRNCISAAMSMGYRMVSASLDSSNFPGLSGVPLGEKMGEMLQPGDIVRFRMDVEGDAAAMDRLLAAAEEKGYQIVLLEDLLLPSPFTVDRDGKQTTP